MIMNKSEQAAKDIIQENGFEILSESNDSFEYSNGAHVFVVSYDDDGVWDCYRVCTIAEYWEDE